MVLTREGLSDPELAVLGREWLLHGHLQDRVGMMLVLERADREAMQQIAIAEWMAASPVYSRRMQRALNFVGSDVGTMMKNLQLDVGAPHQFLDFQFRLDGPEHGEFWLPFCGALADVEPMGEDFVHGMCHTIEDPTFDATAGATNPRAQVRPIHRPPRRPVDRVPHCAWRIDVVPDSAPVEPSELERRVADSEIAALRTPSYDVGGAGMPDYSGPFRADFWLEDLSRGALLTAMDEFAVQSHLLLRAYLLETRRQFGDEVADGLLPRLVRGWCGLTTERLRRAFDLDDTLDGVRSALELHPMFHPRAYTGFALLGDRLEFGGAPDDDTTWLGRADIREVLEVVVQGGFPRARLDDELTVALVDEPAEPAPELVIARISKGALFTFRSKPVAAPVSSD